MSVQREWFEKDYYAILGVSPTASAKDITSAYRKLARTYHPDANPGDSGAEERFKSISAAYDVVGDPDRRKEDDKVRAMGPAAGGRMGPVGSDGIRFDATNITDLLGNLFGRGEESGFGPGGPFSQ